MAAVPVRVDEGLIMIIFGVLSSLLSIALPIVLIVWAVRHFGNRAGGQRNDARSVRRFFQYVLLLGLLIIAAAGLSELLGLPFQKAAFAGDNNTALARALTFTVFGIPMLLLLASWSRRHLRQDPDEAASTGWAFYLTVAPLTALVVAMVALHDVVAPVLSGLAFDGPAAVRFVVWTAVWLVHWTVAHRMLDAGRRQGQLVIGSLIGLGTSVGGLVWLLGASVAALVLSDASTVLVGQERPIAQAAATVVVGIPVWVVYWLRTWSTADRTPLWFAYVLPVGVGVSLVLAVVGASIAVYQVLVWLLGDPSSTQAAQHFEGTPTAVACVVVGALSWWYHRQVLAAATPGRTEVTRVYEYLMAGIALLAAAVGVTLVVVALVESLIPVADIELGTSVVNSLLSGVTLLLVGGPLWWVFWSRIERLVHADGPEELGSPTRRTYLFVLFGLGGVAAIVAVLVAAFFAIQGALQGSFDAQVARDVRIPVAILLAAGAISGYHWSVYRDDRSRLPAPEARLGARYVLLVGAPDPALVGAVEHRTGARVDLWARADGLAGPWVVDDVVAAVQGSASPAMTVVAGPAGLETVGMVRP
ncbi:MAG TPA: DUF5671 domain-containing protein [Cellulomonas sp.]|uniref:DUF5671 domain-containing protein n=1 Tax=Cellulomonas sp. TaxID=40001 RepID=UPI002E31EDFE|nr:DUF5671 domain-containing protein [Cellulomonas sp.]HEX5332276.1 DUF5671 domain-containing protein [Cellulomonas sp.]